MPFSHQKTFTSADYLLLLLRTMMHLHKLLTYEDTPCSYTIILCKHQGSTNLYKQYRDKYALDGAAVENREYKVGHLIPIKWRL